MIRREPLSDYAFANGQRRRTYLDFSLNAVIVLKFQCNTAFDIIDRVISLDNGALTYEVFVNPTITVTGTTPVTVFSTNTRVQRPAQTTITSGWSFTGGTQVDIARIKVANATGQTSTNTTSQLGGRSFRPEDVFYLRLTPTTTPAQGTLYLIWDELDQG